LGRSNGVSFIMLDSPFFRVFIDQKHTF
jgi:hypothetical protein